MHLHLTDQNLDLEQLVRVHRRRRYSFLCITDHPSDISPPEFRRRLERCQRLSSSDFVCIYGLEGETAGGLHIMGIGVDQYIPLARLSLPLAIARIRGAGGLAVLAHPTARQVRTAREDGVVPDGVEVWNALRGGWGPAPDVVAEVRRGGGPWGRLPLYGGPDAHRDGQLFKVATTLAGTLIPDRASIMSALAAGAFELRRGPVRVRATAAAAGVVAAAAHRSSRDLRRSLSAARRQLRGAGVRVPLRLTRAVERWT